MMKMKTMNLMRENKSALYSIQMICLMNWLKG